MEQLERNNKTQKLTGKHRKNSELLTIPKITFIITVIGFSPNSSSFSILNA